jgi:uncharacterized repeat protein (TIGR01451 family)
VPAGSAAAQATADLGVTNLGPDTTTNGADVAYVLTVQNGGPDAADGVSLTDDVPAGTTLTSLVQDSGPAFSCSAPAVGATGTATCTLATLAPGATATFTLTVTVDLATPRGSFVTDQAQVSWATLDGDPNVENDVSTQSTLVGPVITADVGVTVQAPEVAAPGTDIAYAITVQNGGPDPADDATLTDTLPRALTFVSLTRTSGPAFACSTPSVGAAGGTVTCVDPSLAAGASTTFTLVAHVPPATASDDHQTNAAGVTTTVHDPNTENDASTVTTTIGNAAVRASASGPAGVVAGTTITYMLGVVDGGPDPAGSATLADTLPDHTRFVSFTQVSGPPFVLSTPAPDDVGSVTASRALLDLGAPAAQFTLVVAVDIDTLGATTIVNTATASAATGDPNPADNSAAVTTTVAPAAPVLTQVSPSSGRPGTLVGIDGVRLGQIVEVTFGGVPADSFTIDRSDHVTAVAPAGDAGPVDVQLRNATARSGIVSGGRFTFTAAPAAPAAAPAVTLAVPVLPVAGACTSNRVVIVHPPNRARGHLVRSIRATVSGKRTRVSRKDGRWTVRVDLRGRGRATVPVRMALRLQGGHTITSSRTFRTCRSPAESRSA